MSETLANLPAHAAALHRWLGRPAWPTLFASAAIVSIFTIGVVLVALGAVPLWAGAITSFVCIHAGFTVLHEASHRAISGGAKGYKWLDFLIGTVHAALLVYDFRVFRFLHLRHHAHTNDPEKDPDYWMQGMSALKATLLALFVPLHYLRLYVSAVRRSDVPLRDAAATALRITVLLALMLGGIVMAPFETLCLWLVPAALASALLSLAHRMLHAAEISPDRLKTTLIIKGEGLWEWIICPLFWLNNHHLLHHESPRLPVYTHGSIFVDVEEHLTSAGAKVVRVGRRRRT